MTNRDNEGEDPGLAFEAFNLALRVAYEFYNVGDEPAAETENRLWGLVREIAEGKLTIANPGDFAARFPEAAGFIAERANFRVTRDRELASLVLEGFNDMVDRM